MIPLRLQLRGFMSYRQSTTVDFTGIGTACLSGENGAGKSALLEAMSWAIWGKSRASSSRDVVTIGEQEAEVTFDFRLNNADYRVFRRLPVAGRRNAALEFFVRPADGGEEDWQTITGDSQRQTEAKIISTLKLDYETFINSAFLVQGQADLFTQKPPGERKKVLASILNLGEYDQLMTSARERERASRSAVDRLDGQIQRLEQQLTGKADLEREQEQLSQQLIEAGTRVEHLENDVKSAREALNAIETLIRARDTATERLERQSTQLAALQRQASATRANIEKLEALIARAGEIEQNQRDLARWRQTQASLSDTLRQRQPLEARLYGLEREVQQLQSRHEREVDRVQADIRQSRTRLENFDRMSAELATLRAETAGLDAIARNAENTAASLRSLEAEQTRLEAECKSLREEMDKIVKNLELFNAGDARCPICRRPLDEGEHTHIEEDWKADGKKLGDRYREHRRRLKDLETEIPAARAELSRLEAGRNALSGKAELQRRLETELAGKEEVEKALAAFQTRLNELETIGNRRSYAGEQLREIARLQEQLKTLAYDDKLADEATRQIQRLQHADQEAEELRQARTRIEELRADAGGRAELIENLERDIAEARNEIEQISGHLANEPALREQLEQRSDALETARAGRDALQNRFGGVTSRLEELDRVSDDLARLHVERENQALDAEAWHQLYVAFGRDGIQAMIVETILPELEDEANQLLDRMTSSNLRVRFRSTRELISRDSVKETLDIIIRDETGERPYALYSGGEAFRVDFAIRVALSKLLARRAGTTIDMLIVDEGFGTQDARGRDGLVEALRSVEPDFATILVITHIDDVRDLFPTRIEVTRSELGSQVTVV